MGWRPSYDLRLIDGWDHGRYSLETFSKESHGQQLTLMPLLTSMGVGVVHILLRRTVSRVSSPDYQGLSTVQEKPCLSLTVQPVCKHVLQMPFSHLIFIYRALGSPRQDLRDVNMNTSYSKVLNIENIQLCIQPPGQVESRSSYSKSKREYAHGTFTALIWLKCTKVD